jgi:hypothetical protein
VTVGSLYQQRGIADPHDAGGIGGTILAATMGSVAAPVIVAILVPGDPALPTAESVDAAAPRVALDAGDGTVWSGAAESRVGLISGVVAAVLMLGIGVLSQLWALLVVAVAVFALVASMSVLVVRIDRTGDRSDVVTVDGALARPGRCTRSPIGLAGSTFRPWRASRLQRHMITLPLTSDPATGQRHRALIRTARCGLCNAQTAPLAI